MIRSNFCGLATFHISRKIQGAHMSNGMLDNLSAIGGGVLDSLLRPMAQSFGDLLYYALVSDFIRKEIDNFGFNLMERMSALVGTVALTLITIWVVFQGFRILSGQSRDSLMALVLSVLRVTLIVMAATTIGISGRPAHKFITQDLQNVITSAVTGNEDDTLDEQIDQNLAAMQFALASIDAINIVQDPTLNDDKKRAMDMVAIGTAGPAMIGGAMLLLYQVALALFVGLGPLFVLCLIFDQTKPFFSKWLMYGISTMFSMAVLSAMLAIATKLVLGVAGAFWTTTTLSALTGLSLDNGMTTIALQQGGVGLLLTALIVTTPPMAANFFNGAIGSASYFSALGTGSGDVRQNRAGGGVTQQQTAYSAGSRPGEPGYRGDAPVSQGYSSSQGGSVPTQAAQTSYNNPATNPNYGVAAPAPSQGLRGAASPQNISGNPQPPPKGEGVA
jgi:type IV secretion system protein VirB6